MISLHRTYLDKVTTDSRSALDIPMSAERENCENDMVTKVLQSHKTSESGVSCSYGNKTSSPQDMERSSETNDLSGCSDVTDTSNSMENDATAHLVVMKQQNFESRHFTNVAQNWISSNNAYTQKELPGDALVTVPQSDERVYGDHSYSKDASVDEDLDNTIAVGFAENVMEACELSCVSCEGIQAESNVRREQVTVGYWTETGTALCDALQPQHTDNGSTYSLIFNIDDPLS